MAVRYLSNLFSPATWAEFEAGGSTRSGFTAEQWARAGRVAPGDVLLAYVTKRGFVGAFEVLGESVDGPQRWAGHELAHWLTVRPLVSVDLGAAVPGASLASKLSKPTAWQGWIRKNLLGILPSDAAVVLDALREVAGKSTATKTGTSPSKVVLGVDPRRNRLRLRGIEPPPEPSPEPLPDPAPVPERAHLEIQHLLLRLGHARGLNLWVGRGDENRSYNGRAFSDEFPLLTALPTQFAPDAMRTIEYIDVLWLREQTIVAAFEIESTTAIYSGLLRMSDLVATVPNLRLPLYLVAPNARRAKVKREVDRPTFARMSPPLARVCLFLSFESLRSEIEQAAKYLPMMDPAQFVHQLAESLDG